MDESGKGGEWIKYEYWWHKESDWIKLVHWTLVVWREKSEGCVGVHGDNMWPAVSAAILPVDLASRTDDYMWLYVQHRHCQPLTAADWWRIFGHQRSVCSTPRPIPIWLRDNGSTNMPIWYAYSRAHHIIARKIPQMPASTAQTFNLTTPYSMHYI